MTPPADFHGLTVCRYALGRPTDDRFELVKLDGILQGLTAPLVIVTWVIGASSIGAEWQARSITTLLTWEPRRGRVLIAKVVAAMVVACAFSLMAWLLLSAALLSSAYLHGTTAGTDAAWVRSVGGVILRGELMIAFATRRRVGGDLDRSQHRRRPGSRLFLVIENVVGNFLEGFRRWLILGNHHVHLRREQRR